MELHDILGECLYPIILGSNTAGHACVRHMEKRYHVGSTVLTGKRALTLRFLPEVRLVFAPPTLRDDILISMLSDLRQECGYRLPLLIECDSAYHPFITRWQDELEKGFILRAAKDVLEDVTP